ncbi:MAG: site-specific integrase [Cyanobacteria bacterium P01_A01_bin.83]
MYSDNKDKAKVGKVTVIKHRNAYRVRFTYPRGKRHDLKIANATDAGWQIAIKAATLIDLDITNNDIDFSYVRYSPIYSSRIEIAERKPNLIDLWQNYQELSKDRVAATTIKKHWVQYQKHYLGRTPAKLLELDKANDFVAHLLTRYSSGSILPIFSNCLNPSVNLAVKTGKIERNPYAAIPIARKGKKPIEAYEPHEVKAIVSAFYDDRYVKPSSVYPHSYYAPMIDFISLVGCRPSECHALTWDDIKKKNDRFYIRFNKAYSQGILLPHTKTHEIRLFPINQQLKTLLNTMAISENKYNLIFPSVSLGYVNQKTFNRRYWKTVVNGLIMDEKLEKSYRPYSLRHSFITRLVRDGWDIATVARISGNSSETIIRHYLAAKDGFDIPEL